MPVDIMGIEVETMPPLNDGEIMTILFALGPMTMKGFVGTRRQHLDGRIATSMVKPGHRNGWTDGEDFYLDHGGPPMVGHTVTVCRW